MKSGIRFGIIGCGRIAQRHAEHINKLGHLVAVCDVIPSRANEMGQQYGVKSYTLIEELLDKEKEIDVISVCSPNGLHAEHSIKALNKGFHVLCEKPMAINVHDCGEMIQAAERANRRLPAKSGSSRTGSNEAIDRASAG